MGEDERVLAKPGRRFFLFQTIQWFIEPFRQKQFTFRAAA
jgi:hypothetical protein